MKNRLFYLLCKYSFKIIAVIFLIILFLAVIFKHQIFNSSYASYFQNTFWYIFGILTGMYLLNLVSGYLRNHHLGKKD